MSKHNEFAQQAVKEMHAKREAHEALWRLSEAAWSVDQNAGTIKFTLPDGATATCPLQIVGTYNTADSSWLWGWDHPAVAPAVAQHAKQTLAYGEKNCLKRLTTRKLECHESEAWEFTAIACKLNDAQGVYRGVSGPTQVYMTYGEVTLSGKPKSTVAKKTPASKKPKADATSAKTTSTQSTSTTSADMAEAGTTSPADCKLLANPSDAVRAFIAGIHTWETKAHRTTSDLREKRRADPDQYDKPYRDAQQAVIDDYNALIARFCTTTVKANVESYGDPPEHDPTKEVVVSEKIKGNTAVVGTKGADSFGNHEFEYRLKKFGDVWRLWSMRVVEKNGKKYQRL
jgi:hypothetical protein